MSMPTNTIYNIMAAIVISMTFLYLHSEADGTPVDIVPVDRPGVHMDELPLDQSVVNFSVH